VSAVQAPRPGRTGLLVAGAQWLATPGDHEGNLDTAALLINRAGAAGADIVVLPELWACGYDVSTLAADAAAAAERVPGRRTEVIGDLARRHGMWVFAGSVPESDGGQIYNTALVFSREGAMVARHRKAHLYQPTGEETIFAAGDCLTSFVDSELGHVGVIVCYDGDFPGADFDDGAFDNFAGDKAGGASFHGFFHGEHNNDTE